MLITTFDQIDQYDFRINMEDSAYRSCLLIQIDVPDVATFGIEGEKKFGSISFVRNDTETDNAYGLMGKGTDIAVQYSKSGHRIRSSMLCIDTHRSRI